MLRLEFCICSRQVEIQLSDGVEMTEDEFLARLRCLDEAQIDRLIHLLKQEELLPAPKPEAAARASQAAQTGRS